ncbi:MAG: ATP-binding protein [Desulfuromonadaceae bacterium]|nr:ATP-binding protein [Desulfuromonadaceae bacterium]MDD2856818.1 ATP-binding protein [Desulfuromonadaceae bacterium]
MPAKYNIPVVLTLIAAGLAGNYFNFPIFLNIDFIFGSIFSMLAFQLFGVSRALPVAALIAAYTYILWHHPYAIIIMTAEVAVVGWLVERRKFGMVLADTLYWLFIGIPLVYLFYHVVMGSPLSSTSIVMTKQAVNGITNTLIARLIFTGYAFFSLPPIMSYRENIYNILAFFVLCPVLVILAYGSRGDFADTDHTIRSTLVSDTLQSKQYLDVWQQDRKKSIDYLSRTALNLTPAQMQPRLDQLRQTDRNFEILALLNKDAVTTAYSPTVDQFGESTIGKSYADRPYISTLKRDLKPMLSEVAMSRYGVPGPRVRMIAPVVVNGTFGGYISGVLKLGQIKDYLDSSVGKHSSFYTMIDKTGSIIMSNRADHKVMTKFTRERGSVTALEDGISQWIPIMSGNVSIMERWKKSFYIAETTIGDSAEWKLILEQPVAPYQKKLYNAYTEKLTLLFIILLGALILAELLTSRIILTIDKICQITQDLPFKILADDTHILWPSSAIVESNRLINNFKDMTDALEAVFTEKRHINLVLEQRVEERTQQLREAKELSEVANKAKSRFLAIVAHEFRTPLGLLTVSADILGKYRNHLPLEDQLEQYDQIRAAAGQISSLVDSVSAYNQQERGDYVLNPVPVDINTFFAGIASDVAKVWSKGHDFSVSIHPECGVYSMDETLLRRLLENLLTNAFRFTLPGGKVSLSVCSEGNLLMIEVSDTGIGIPEEDQSKIFEAFYRSRNVDARRGVGLGLSIVNDAVRILKGSITLSSKLGEGSIFWVEIPLDNSLEVQL